MNVLSITKMMLCSLQILATAATSVHLRVGLVGDSIHMSLVFDLIAALTFLRSEKSIKSNSIPFYGVYTFLIYL